MSTSCLQSCSDTKKIASDWVSGLKKERKSVSHPILPKAGEKNLLITSALPYVNNVPHLGNIIGCVLSADCFARFARLRGYNTLFICGTDEYGTATETKAIEENCTCQEICDKYHKIHKEVYDWFNISFDFFGRTTTNSQTVIAQDIFMRLYQRGYLLKDNLEQLYCQPCDRYLADRFVEGTCPSCSYPEARGDQCDKCGKIINAIELVNPKCKLCKSTPIVKNSNHLFLDLPKLEPQLLDFVSKSQGSGCWAQSAVSITKGWLQEGLKPRCITRDLKWGTPVPLDEYASKVLYVWFDAPIGYISITAEYTKEWEKWWKNPQQVTLVNFMAKDNVPFHTVIFPASLLGAEDNYTLLNDISSIDYLNYENSKFSKSRGVGVFGNNAMDSEIPADIFRLYLLSNRPENHDTSFNWDDLIAHNNNECINNIGNFINRALMLLYKKLDGKTQPVTVGKEEAFVICEINQSLKNFIDCMDKYKMRESFNHLLQISSIGNKYFQNTKPWELKVEDPAQKDQLGSILSFSLNIVALITILLEPFAPKISEKIRNDIGFSDKYVVLDDVFVQLIPSGLQISNPTIYFSKIDQKRAAELRVTYGGNDKKAQTNGTSNGGDKSNEQLDQLLQEQVTKLKELRLTTVSSEKVDSEFARLRSLIDQIQKTYH